MHPFYGPSGRLLADRSGRTEGIASMAAYLAFWAVVVAVAKREMDLRWPRNPVPTAQGDRAIGDSDAGRTVTDPALEALRLRYARGEVDRDTFLAMRADLGASEPGTSAPGASDLGASDHSERGP
jgi:hypothetical protein